MKGAADVQFAEEETISETVCCGTDLCPLYQITSPSHAQHKTTFDSLEFFGE